MHFQKFQKLRFVSLNKKFQKKKKKKKISEKKKKKFQKKKKKISKNNDSKNFPKFHSHELL